MKGDFTKRTEDPGKRYSSVQMQQGRVQLDADWNEQVAIDAHLRETGVRDVVGPSGAPLDGGGFRIESAQDGSSLAISPGRIYVEGILCELASGPVVALGQPIVIPVPLGPGTGTAEALQQALAAKQDGAQEDRPLPPPPPPPTFTLDLSTADVSQLDLAAGDTVKILYLDALSRENEAGPFHVNSLGKPVNGRVTVTLAGSMFPVTGSPRLRREITYLDQPDLPGAEDVSADGAYLAYLDVWARHLTWLDDPDIRETALGGPDTTTRVKTIAQVRLLRIGDATETDAANKLLNCLSKPDLWNGQTAASSGRLTAQTQPPPAADGPCVVPSTAGYTGLENQLYRVEIHQGGTLPTPAGQTPPTFKWSRENGSVVTDCRRQDGDKITVGSTGRDAVLGIRATNWVELDDDTRELQGRPGLLLNVVDQIGDVVQFAPGAVNLADFPANPKLRRWESDAQALSGGRADGWLALERGIEIQFSAGTYRTGDYWLIPARAFIGQFAGDIEWPREDGPTGPRQALPPRGIEHHYCKLAVVVRTGGAGASVWSVRGDCRDLFPPLTGLIHLEKLCGDGQEALPGETLAEPLRLAVLNGGLPMPGRSVHLEVSSGGGSLVQGAAQRGPSLVLTSDLAGVVEVSWTLGASQPQQRVLAKLVDPEPRDVQGNPVDVSVCFTAHLSVASQVAYTPGADCKLLAGAATVQAALDLLCGNVSLSYAGGGGQTGSPLTLLAFPLEVRVANGRSPVEGATVHFSITNDDKQGLLSEKRDLKGAKTTLDVPAGSGGIARCFWRLDGGTLSQRVHAELDDRGAGAVDFEANIVSGTAAVPRIVITGVATATGAPLANDSPLPVDQLAPGLRVTCDQEIADLFKVEGRSLGATKPNFHVVLYVPYTPLGKVVGFQPVVLASTVAVDKNDKKVIVWIPVEPTSSWLAQIFQGLNRPPGISGDPAVPIDRLLVVVRIEGGFVWGGKNADLSLDGDAFGQPAKAPGRIDLVLPSGDGQRGGDFAMWFWLTGQSGIPIQDTQDAVLPPSPPSDSSRTPAPPSPPAPALADVKGIGPVALSRLQQAGITQVAQVAAMEPAQLAKIVQVSEARAKKIIENAKLLQAGKPELPASADESTDA